MTVDVRAKVKCSLGELISGSISDSQLANAGLIFTRGSCKIKGLIKPAVGAAVSFSYVRSIRNAQSTTPTTLEQPIVRKLYVIGSSANPATNSTDVEFCCKLTALRNFSEDVKFSAKDADLIDNDTELTPEDEDVVTRPISAENLTQKILGKLGLQKLGALLFNTFSIPFIDLSGGYINVLNDLLYSESLVGYQVSDGEIQVVSSTLLSASSVTSISTDEVIELEPMSIGDPPPATMEVSFSTVKLKEPDDGDPKLLNWELEESYGEPTTVTVDVPDYETVVVAGTTLNATNRTVQYTYTPYTKTETAYDTLDRVVSRVTTEHTILAAIAPGYVQANGIELLIQPTAPGAFVVTAQPPPAGNLGFTIVRTETTTYKVPAPTTFPVPPDYDPTMPEGYEEVLKVETVVSEPLIKLIGSTNIYRYAGERRINFTYGNTDSARYIASKEIRTQETATGAQGQQVTKSYTERYACRASYTVPGQQGIVEAIDRANEYDKLFGENGRAIGLILDARSLEKVGTETQILTGREVGLQQRPPQSERTLGKWATNVEGDKVSLAVGAGFGKATVNLPYAPHDKFFKNGAKYVVAAAMPPASTVATNFGRNAIAYLTGLRHGFALRTIPSKLPSKPAAAISLSANGASGLYMPSTISYVMDATGIIASADLIFIGGGYGSMASAWFPVAPGITAGIAQPTETDLFPTNYYGQIASVGVNAQTTLNGLYPTAAVGDGVQAADTLDIWRYDGTVWVNVGAIPTATFDAPIPPVAAVNITPQLQAGTRTSVQVQSLPYALSLLTTLALTTKTAMGAARILAINVPLSDVSITVYAPAVRIGAAVAAPTSTLAVATLAPAVAIGAAVQVPLSTVGVAALVPKQAGPDGAAVLVPATSIAVAALVPEGVGANLETFYNSWRLQVYGTDAWVFPDWWAD